MNPFPIPYQPSDQEKQIAARFGPEGLRFDPAQAAPQGSQTFVICFTNRCGSNFLAQLLATNPDIGLAGEYFNAPAVLGISEKLGFVRLQQYLDWLMREKASRKGIFGIKLAFRQLFFLAQHGLLPAFGEVKYIHMRRLDVLAQNVSHVIAWNTKAWTSEQQPVADPADVVIDDAQILRMMKVTNHENAKFAAYFKHFGITPVRLTYEKLVENPARAGARVLSELAFREVARTSVDPSKVTMRKQANGANEAAIARIRQRLECGTGA
jgi:LPS sulfotransferase NodH